MKKNAVVGLFYGESFYEISLLNQEDKKLIYFDRFYAPRMSLKNQIKSIIESHPEITINHVIIASRFVEKIFGFKLGGTVAQLVTKGFEKWLPLHQKNNYENSFKIEIAPDLSSDDMIFSVVEQTSTAGEIEIELEEKEIQSLIQKLKQKESKRVCVHLVNAHKNNLNTEKLSSALSEAGFEVFNPLTLMKKVGLDHTPTDFPLWRLNLIEASTSGTFCELKDQINEAFSPYIDKQKIKFLDHNLKAHDGEAGSRISTLFAAENAVFQFLRNKNIIPEKTDVFHFGQENFSILNSNKQCWQSPWGTTGIQTFVRQDLKIQPTNSFYLNSFEEIEITKSEETFEPGPMSYERGRIPCVYDILNSENLSKELHKKVKDSFWAMVRSSKTSHSENKTFDEFREIILTRLLWEIQAKGQQESLVIIGKWAEKYANFFKKSLLTKNIIVIKESEYPISYMLAHEGNISL